MNYIQELKPEATASIRHYQGFF